MPGGGDFGRGDGGFGDRFVVGRNCPILGMGLICEIVFGRFGDRARGAAMLEFVQSAVEGALDAGLVARKRLNRAGAGGVVGKGAGAGIEGVVVVRELGHADGEEAGFEGAEAAQAPRGHGHLLDEQGLGGSRGLIFVEKSIPELAEFLRIFAGEDGGLGGEAVAERVMGDGGAPFGSARAGGEFGVATVGVELALGKHES